MSFFYNEAKSNPAPARRAPSRGKTIPIASLQKMGCQACPRDADAKRLRTPKMEPSGAQAPLLYLLGPGLSEDEDETGEHWTNAVGKEIVAKLGRDWFRRNTRSSHITQCLGLGADTQATIAATECCRGRVTADIEASKPLIVLAVGDTALAWAVNSELGGNAMTWRGALVSARFGSHVCWVLPAIWPNYVEKEKRSRGRSEYELTVEHDLREVVRMLSVGDFWEPVFEPGPFDTGIEYITGQEPGDMPRLEAALEELAREPSVGLDLETGDAKTGRGLLRPRSVTDPRIWVVGVGTHKRTLAFALDHPEGWGTEDRKKRVWRLFGAFLAASGRKVCHNLAFEMEWLAYFFGTDLLRQTEWEDTMAMAHTFDGRPGTKSLDVQTRVHFGFPLKTQSRVDPKRLLEYPLREALRYVGMDAKWTHRLALHYRERFFAGDVRSRELYEAKIRTASTLVLLEAQGMPVDFAFAEELGRRYTKEIADTESKIQRCDEVKRYTSRFGTFSPSNPDHVLQLMKTVCERDEVRVEERGAGGAMVVRWTTEEEALARIPRAEVPSAALVLQHRGVSKIHGTYVEPILERRIVNPDGFMRAKYSQLTAVTSRLASEDPNAQNFPKRKYREVRGIIYAGEGLWIVAFDYGQIEFRVVGMCSEDEALVRACWTDYDVHKHWAERMVALHPRIKDYIVEEFEVDWDAKGLKTLRQEAKNGWVFPQLFGSSVRSCAEQLHLPEDVATELAGEFWDEFRATKRWQEKLLQSYERNLYVETLGGHRRSGPMTKNEIINLPIQGTAYEIICSGMNAVSERASREADPWMQPRLNVHDDLSFWMPDVGLEPRIAAVVEEMCKPRFDYINVPLMVEVSVGPRWSELEEIAKYRSDVLFGTPNPYAKER